MRRCAPLIAALAAMLAGCTGGVQTSNDVSDSGSLQPVEGTLKVALLVPGSVSDSGWSAMAFDGLMAIQSELGAEVNHQEAPEGRIDDAMRTYAQEGYHLIIGHGFEYNTPGARMAANFPNTVFVSSSGGETATNAGAFRFYLEQGFFLAGAFAALQSQSNVIGMVGASQVPSIESTFEAFEAGAKHVRPDVRVLKVYTNREDDVAAARQAAQGQINQGADVIIHQANAAAQGVFDAARDAGILAIGANLNQNDNPSGAVAASAFIVARPAFVELARQVQAGTYRGQIQVMGMPDGAIDFVVNPAFEDRLFPGVSERVEELRQQILTGDLEVPKLEF